MVSKGVSVRVEGTTPVERHPVVHGGVRRVVRETGDGRIVRLEPLREYRSPRAALRRELEPIPNVRLEQDRAELLARPPKPPLTDQEGHARRFLVDLDGHERARETDKAEGPLARDRGPHVRHVHVALEAAGWGSHDVEDPVREGALLVPLRLREARHEEGGEHDRVGDVDCNDAPHDTLRPARPPGPRVRKRMRRLNRCVWRGTVWRRAVETERKDK